MTRMELISHSVRLTHTIRQRPLVDPEQRKKNQNYLRRTMSFSRMNTEFRNSMVFHSFIVPEEAQVG